MLAELAISVSIGALAFSAWYFICVHANRRKALRILRWMEAALAGRGHVTGIRWLSSCRFQIDVRLPRSNFRRASFLAQLTPRELPLMTTSSDWKREISSMMTSLLATREQDVLSVRFQRRSPHFSATLPLSSLPARAHSDSSLMDSLRELATEASASPT